MFLKNYKPKTPSLRFKKNIYSLNYIKNFKNIFFLKYKNNSGKNKKGKTIIWSKTHNKHNNFYQICYKKILNNKVGLIISINKNNKNSNFLALIKYANNSLCYIKLINGLFIGSYFTCSNYKLNNSIPYTNILGTFTFLSLAVNINLISNLSLYQVNRAKYALSAGTYLLVFYRYNELSVSVIILPSGFKKLFSNFSKIFIGRNSNIYKKYSTIGKAGININFGWKPVVRGVAMNPVDHPHGGRTKTNKPEVSPWGWVAKKGK